MGMFPVGAIVASICYGIFMLAMLAGYVLMVIIGWKIMKAHELLANSVKELTAGKPKE